MNAERAMVVLMVTIGTWIAMFFKTSSLSFDGSVSRFLPNPCLTDKVKNAVDTIARIWKAFKSVYGGDPQVRQGYLPQQKSSGHHRRQTD